MIPFTITNSSLLTSLKSVGVQRSNRWLIRNIDLEIRSGEIITLIGPNGSGKTTIVKVIIGALTPDVGTIEWVKELRLGYVPQKINIDSTLPMTVRRLMNLTKQNSDFEIDKALDELNILKLANSQVQNLSGGEFQRALIARALLRKPDLLILDEPNRGLDIKGEASLYDQIVDIRNRLNCGVLLVCHNLHLVMKKTDTVVCLNGHICCQGVPDRVVNNDAYIQLFGADIQRTHAPYSHHHDHSHDLDGSIAQS